MSPSAPGSFAIQSCFQNNLQKLVRAACVQQQSICGVSAVQFDIGSIASMLHLTGLFLGTCCVELLSAKTHYGPSTLEETCHHKSSCKCLCPLSLPGLTLT